MFMPWFEFYEVKFFFVIIFQKEKGNTYTLLIIFIVKSLQKEQKSTNLLNTYYESQSAGINVQSPQSESTPRSLTLACPHYPKINFRGNFKFILTFSLRGPQKLFLEQDH